MSSSATTSTQKSRREARARRRNHASEPAAKVVDRVTHARHLAAQRIDVAEQVLLRLAHFTAAAAGSAVAA
eukprot:360465-Chlamydomonas_euryale.AAC.14